MNKLSIRKLTPKECWRLMGFDDIDFEKANNVCSNTQLYKQAGNSIVVNVLVEILRNLLRSKINLYSSNDSYKLYQGNMLDMLDVIEPNSIDSIITDPPYELNFMSKGWDNVGVSFQPDTWEKCYEVLKPGGYLLAFGGSRTFHRIACAIEDAGFEIRDTIMWLYGSGFPKSMNIGLAIDKKNGVESIVVGKSKSGSTSKAFNDYQYRIDNGIYSTSGEYQIKEAQNKWNGWGTALKPSFEPIIVARKPFKGSLVDNVIKNGVGGINIHECRVGNEERQNQQAGFIRRGRTDEEVFLGTDKNRPKGTLTVNGRFPANTILTYDETDFEEVCGGFPNTKSTYNSETKHENIIHRNNADFLKYGYKSRIDSSSYNDSGNASRYFYCAKSSKKDRDEGLEESELKIDCDRNEECYSANVPFNRSSLPKKNIHPTVKPTSLMQYLVRLVTPNNGIILDPFNGSGSTGKAVMYENKERNKNYKYIGIEMTEEYLPISKARIEYVYNQIKDSKVQISIDDME